MSMLRNTQYVYDHEYFCITKLNRATFSCEAVEKDRMVGEGEERIRYKCMCNDWQ